MVDANIMDLAEAGWAKVQFKNYNDEVNCGAGNYFPLSELEHPKPEQK
jgi:hypothetical protein